MKGLKTLLILLLFSVMVSAQNKKDRTFIETSDKTIVVINNELIGNMKLLTKVDPDNLTEIKVINHASFSKPGKSLFMREAKSDSDRLIIALVEKKVDFESKSQAELNHFFGLEKSNDIYVNGHLVDDKKQRIAVASIKKVELIPADETFLKKPVLNINLY